MNADKTSKTEVGLKLTRWSNCGALDGQRPVSGSPSPRRFWPSGLQYGYARILGLSWRFSRLPLLCRTPPVVLLDPAGDAVLYTAAHGNADVLCTRNLRHFSQPEVLEFCTARGIRVMTDLDALRKLGILDPPPI
jgi:hypothetical protein